MLVPAGKTRGIFPVSLGLVKALNDKGTKAVLFTPFTFCGKSACTMTAVDAKIAFAKIAEGNKADVLQTVVSNYHKLVEAQNPDIVIVEGFCEGNFDNDELNADVCHALDADIIGVVSGACKNSKRKPSMNIPGSGVTVRNIYKKEKCYLCSLILKKEYG